MLKSIHVGVYFARFAKNDLRSGEAWPRQLETKVRRGSVSTAIPEPTIPDHCVYADSNWSIDATSCFTASTLFLKSAVSFSVKSNSIIFSTPPLPMTTGTPT